MVSQDCRTGLMSHAWCAQGISNKTAQCETCGQKLADCAGHFGEQARAGHVRAQRLGVKHMHHLLISHVCWAQV